MPSELDIKNLISILTTSKHLYTSCPNCQEKFSLHEGGLLYDKTNSNDILKDMNKKHTKEINTWEKDYSKLEEHFNDFYTKAIETQDELGTKFLHQKDLQKLEIKNFKDREKTLKTNHALLNKEVIKEKTEKSLTTQRSVMIGRLAEIFPMLGKVKGLVPQDLMATVPSQPVDFIWLNGLSNKKVNQITFFDVKTGGAGLTPTQKSIQNTIEDGNVDFKKLRVNFKGLRIKGKWE